MKIRLTSKKKIKIGFIILLCLFLIPEKKVLRYGHSNIKKRVRYIFPSSLISKLFSLKQRTYIMIDSIGGSKDRVIFIFNYWNGKAYQFVKSEYGNSSMTMNLEDVE